MFVEVGGGDVHNGQSKPDQRGCVFIGVILFVCLFVSRIMQKNYFAGFHKIRLKGGTWIMEIVEIQLDFGVRMDHIRLELGYRTWYG